MSTRADQRAARFGLNLRQNCVTRDLTVGQITEVIHAYVQSQTADGKRQYELTLLARRAFRVGNLSESLHWPVLSKQFEL